MELNHKYLEELLLRYPVLSISKDSIWESYKILEQCYKGGGKLLIAGNGGSAADADHIVGELMKGFCLPREVSKPFAHALNSIDPEMGGILSKKLQNALPAIALTNHNALNTAFLNDVDGLLCFAQQIMGYGKAGDVFLGISTSGNSENILYAAVTARAKGLKVIGLTGKTGGNLTCYTDTCIKIDEKETYKVQELHLPVYHCLCLMLEEHYFI